MAARNGRERIGRATPFDGIETTPVIPFSIALVKPRRAPGRSAPCIWRGGPTHRRVIAAIVGCTGAAALLHPAIVGAAAVAATPFALAEGNNNGGSGGGFYDNVGQYSTSGTETATYLSYSGYTGAGSTAVGSGILYSAGFTAQPQSVAYDSSGDLFVSGGGTNTVYEVSAGGVASAFATGTASAVDLAVDPVSGYIYLDHGSTLQAFNSSGTAEGTITISSSVAASASLQGMAFDSAGDLYVTDSHNLEILKLLNSGGTPSGTQSVFTNNYNTTTFLNPHGVAVDSSGNVYLADSASGSFAGAIYEFSSGGSAVNYDTNFNEITNGSGGPYSPYGLQVDANGNLFGTIKSRIYGTQTVYEVSLNGGSSTLSPLYSSAQGGTNGNDMFYYFAFNNAPEPSSLCLLGLGGLTLLARRRRA